MDADQQSLEGGLLADIWRSISISPNTAREILGWKFTDAQFARMHELAELNRQDAVSPAQRAELESALSAGQFLSVLHAKARAALASDKKCV